VLISLSALAPIAVALALILLLRVEPLLAAAAGLISAVLVAGLSAPQALAWPAFLVAGQTALAIAVSAASVIVPGLLLNHELGRRGGLSEVAEGLRALGMEPARCAVILLLGLFPALECLTGFGISLLLAVPVLVRLLGPAAGVPVALLGMHIMAWGTLALATLVGAALADMPPELLGGVSALLQAPALGVVALIGLGTIGGTAALARHGIFAVLLAMALAALLHLNTRFLLIETTGVLAGLGVTLIGFGWEAIWGRLRPKRNDLARLRGLAPFAAALVLLLAFRLVPPIASFLGGLLVIGTERLSITPLASPGVALLLVALFLALRGSGGFRWRAPLTRAVRPVAAVLAFVLLAQVMQETGLLQLAVRGIAALPFAVLVPLMPALGMLGGFTTGSAIAGNALFMPTAVALGGAHGFAYDFAAIQNAAAGHGAFASLPIVTLTVAIAGQSGLKASLTVPDLTRFGLRAALLIYAALAAGFALFLGLAGV
jgi:lactate permease